MTRCFPSRGAVRFPSRVLVKFANSFQRETGVRFYHHFSCERGMLGALREKILQDSLEEDSDEDSCRIDLASSDASA